LYFWYSTKMVMEDYQIANSLQSCVIEFIVDYR